MRALAMPLAVDGASADEDDTKARITTEHEALPRKVLSLLDS